MIFDHQKMGIKDTRILGADRLRDLLLHLQDLRPRGDKTSLETGNLSRDVAAIYLSFRWFFVFWMVDEDSAATNPGGNADTTKPYFLIAHSRSEPNERNGRFDQKESFR